MGTIFSLAAKRYTYKIYIYIYIFLEPRNLISSLREQRNDDSCNEKKRHQSREGALPCEVNCNDHENREMMILAMKKKNQCLLVENQLSLAYMHIRQAY